MEPKVTIAEGTRHFSMMGVDIKVRASAADTGGRLSALEQVVRPGAGSPLHTVTADKVLIVLDGAFQVTLGTERRELRAGESATIPAGVPHNFRNSADTPSRLMMLLLPGGHEDFLAEVAADPTQIAAVSERHGVRLLPPAA